MTRNQVVRAAMKWNHVKWVHQGRTQHGVDCIGFLGKVAEDVGVEYEDRTDYSHQPDGRLLREHLLKHLVVMPMNADKHGLIGLFRERRFPCHVGIYANLGGVLHLIHARAAAGEVVVEPMRPDTRLYLVSLLAFPGLED